MWDYLSNRLSETCHQDCFSGLANAIKHRPTIGFEFGNGSSLIMTSSVNDNTIFSVAVDKSKVAASIAQPRFVTNPQ